MGYAKRTLGDKMKKWDGALEPLTRRQLRGTALLTAASAAQCASSF